LLRVMAIFFCRRARAAKKMKNYFHYVLLLLLLFSPASKINANFSSKIIKPRIKFKGKKTKTLRRYQNALKKYSEKLCTPGAEQKFWRYMGQFVGNGFYVPATLEHKLDLVTVNRFIPELERKKKWIDSLKEKVGVNQKFEKEIKQVKEFQDTLTKLLEYKRQYFEVESAVEKERARIRSKYLIIKFKNDFKSLLNKIPFMLSYRYPIDHFDLRLTYDKNKIRNTEEKTFKANEVYFYRKIVQDGAHNPNQSGSDTFLRTAIDTISLEISKEWVILPENLRYDLNFALDAIIYHLEKGSNYLIPRLKEWSDRTARMIGYYKSLKKNKIQIGQQIVNADQLLKNKDEARLNLKRYSLKKQAEAYRFWKKQPIELRALFVLDTILYNEVGGLDGRDALERKDVAQVVINRVDLDEYNSILMTDSLFPYLSQKAAAIITNPWLNVLFKEGEFSFTYYFIGGNLRIFCPETTRHGNYLRKRNLKMVYDLLQKPNYEFEAVRYFSRHSMLGRIDMAQIWSEFTALGERAGLLTNKNEELKKLYKNGKYQYLYHFIDDQGRKFKVLSFDNKIFVKSNNKLQFFKYRNPHFFRYFKKR
jgi:hypothetical protein